MKTDCKQFPKSMPVIVNDKPKGVNFRLTEVCTNTLIYRGKRLPNRSGGLVDIKCSSVHGYSNLYTLTITARAGYEFDGASIPRVFWFIGHPMSPKFQRAALIHDILYGFRTDRETNDELFYQLLLEDGVNKFRAKLMWTAVRVGGVFYYL